MLPAQQSLSSSRLLACMRRMRPMRSRLPRPGLSATDPDSSVPEYTRKKVKLPTNGSLAILNASAANGASSEDGRVSFSVSSSGFVPSIGGTSTGDGKKLTTASSNSCTPLFLKAEPHNTGTQAKLQVAL